MEGWLAIATSIVVAFVPYGAYNYFKAELLDDPTYRKRVATALISHAYLEGYRDRLEQALTFLKSWMGDLDSWRGVRQGLYVCYLFAMGYAAIFFFLSWTVGGPFGIGQTNLLPDLPGWQRVLWFIGAFPAAIVVYIPIIIGARFIEDYERVRVYIAVGCALVVFIAVTTAYAGPLFVAVALVMPIVPAFAIIIAYGIALEDDDAKVEFGMIGVIALTIASVIAFAFALAGNLSAVLFFVALPFANMVFDCLSWWISRWLGQHLLDQTRGESDRMARFVVIGGHALLDIAAAILFLFLLAITLPFVIELYNLWTVRSGLPQPLELRPFIDRAAQDPWPNAIWILLMLLSTLIPTLLHAGALIASPLALWLMPTLPKAKIALELVETDDPAPWVIRSAAWHQVRFWLIAITAPLTLLALFVWAVSSLTGGVARHLVWTADIGIWLAHQLAGG